MPGITPSPRGPSQAAGTDGLRAHGQALDP